MKVLRVGGKNSWNSLEGKGEREDEYQDIYWIGGRFA